MWFFMNEHGIYLVAPDGYVIAELHIDVKLRARQRWYRSWHPHQDVISPRGAPKPISCSPSNPSKLCQV